MAEKLPYASGLPYFMKFRILLLAALLPFAVAAADRPNIVIMMVDDLGYSDFGCYGSEIETPHIDALAENGLRFRNFYNTAKCHSSRVSLLTGLWSDQAEDRGLTRGVTIAQVLEKAGYATLMTGKWHLDDEPTDHGFQRYFGHLSGCTNFFNGDDTRELRGEKSFRLDGEPWNDFDDDFYTTNAFIDWAKVFISDSLEEDADKPFFLYVAHNAPHYPLQVIEEDFRKYENRYDAGWDSIRQDRYRRQLESGLIPDKWVLAPRPINVPPWDELDDEEKDWETRRMAAFAGMVDRVDQSTGELVEFLKEKGEYENTVILICSDNGACPFDRTSGEQFEPWDPRSYWCYDVGWSHVGNTPFRLHKQNQHEGGISSPLIAHWPAGMTTERGSVTDEVSHLVDFMATAVELAGTEYPDEWPDTPLEPLQGKSLVPTFKGEDREPHDYLFFRFSENRALRSGDWKIVNHRGSRWELYDLAADGTELHDLADRRPDLVEELAEIWRRTAEDLGYLPEERRRPVSDNEPPHLNKDGTPEFQSAR